MRKTAELLRAMGDETRLKMLWLMLNHRELCVCDFIAFFAVARCLQRNSANAQLSAHAKGDCIMGNANAELAEMAKKIAALEAENTKLKTKAKRGSTLSMKVSQKGGVSVYGLGRFPVTLYRSQWDKLIEFVPQVSDFIKENADSLATKD